MPAILDRILHLASQTIILGPHVLEDTLTRHPKYVVMVSLQPILFLKNVWYNLNQ